MDRINIKYDFNDEYFINEATKTLRTNIQFCGRSVKAVVFTSSDPNEGKTTVCIGLAKAFAEDGKKILLVDADMRNSVMVSRYTDITGVKGFSQYLSGMATIDEVKYQTEQGFDIIFSGAFPPNPAELLGSPEFSSFIEEQKKLYDYVFIDCPPLGFVIDAAIAAASCDSSIIVIGAGVAKYKDVDNVKQQLEKSGCNVLGAVINNVKGSGHHKAYY